MTTPDYNYERRRRLIDAGTCVVCAKLPATRGQKCERCADRHLIYKRKVFTADDLPDDFGKIDAAKIEAETPEWIKGLANADPMGLGEDFDDIDDFTPER